MLSNLALTFTPYLSGGWSSTTISQIVHKSFWSERVHIQGDGTHAILSLSFLIDPVRLKTAPTLLGACATI